MAIPDREDVKEIDLGIPTYGEIKAIDQEIYSKLRSEGEILEKIAPPCSSRKISGRKRICFNS